MRGAGYKLVLMFIILAFFMFNGCVATSVVTGIIDKEIMKRDLKNVGEYPCPTLPKGYKRQFLGTTAYFMKITGEGDKNETELHKDIEKAAQYHLNELAPNTQLFYTLSPDEFKKSYAKKSLTKKDIDIDNVLAAKIEFFGTISGEERISLLNERSGERASYKDIVKSKAMVCSLSVSLHRKIEERWCVVASGKGESKFPVSDNDLEFYSDAYKDSYKGQYKTREPNNLDRVHIIKIAIDKALRDLLPKIVTEFDIRYDVANKK